MFRMNEFKNDSRTPDTMHDHLWKANYIILPYDDEFVWSAGLYIVDDGVYRLSILAKWFVDPRAAIAWFRQPHEPFTARFTQWMVRRAPFRPILRVNSWRGVQ